jgi:glycosyltransferase involved in cell wall biosynthesis
LNTPSTRSGRRRIVHAITRLDLGGAQQNTLFCIASHDRDRYEPALVAGEGGILDDEARAIRGAEIRIVPWLRHPIHPLWDPVAVVRMSRLLRSLRADLVHTHSSKAGIVGRFAARLARVPAIVHTVHGWSFNDEQPRPLRMAYEALERVAGSFTHRIVVVAESDRRKGLCRGIGRPERYRLVRSGIDAAAYLTPARPRDEVRRGLGYSPSDVVVGTLACLKPQKAPLDFVETARIAVRREPRLRFFIAGDGPLRERVEAAIREASLERAVRVLGWRRDVPDLLHAMDAFLLTSHFEGLPRAVLQAMAAGVPVVATAVDGTPDVVRDGETGLLVPPGRPDLAADRILDVVADAARARSRAERAKVLLGEEFDIRAMVRKVEAVYAELLDSTVH